MEKIKESIVRHMKVLCEEIGARATGSKANTQAVQYAAETLERLGYEVTLQEFPCIDWQNRGAQLKIDGQALEVEVAEYAAPCEDSGELVFAETLEQLRNLNATNKLCVIYGELCKEPLMPKSMTFWNPEEHQAIIRELEEQKPSAVITVSFLSEVAVPIIQDGDFDIPCATVKGKYLPTLLQGKQAELTLDTERRQTTAANVIATFGQGKKVSFSAHIDTKPTTPGALDNASGTAALLVLAERLAKTEETFQKEIVLFNGEDYYSMPGEMTFMNQSLTVPEEYLWAVNVDGIGMKDSKTSYSFYACSELFEQRFERFAVDNDEFEKTEPWPMGDHMLFAGAGIPAIALTSSKITTLMEMVMHTPKDNLSIVDYERIAETVCFLDQAVETFTEE
ncbi:aminopeptidase [Enterococcus florum]|uniref:Aminopeptidase n=1 Tax=Enterococcus florum TaxID=2480627 RepID=A0A4P5PA42_9ENTE|nr:M28 family peptidase [Enterococcus florum]GCF94957.1 aminopeptidase [Enterococcus florum]